MIATFLVTAASIIVGAIISALLFGNLMNIPEIPESYGTIIASFIGGPENLFAVADGVALSDNAMGNVLILIELAYSPWLIFLMTGIPALYKIFNKFVNAEMDTVIAAGERINLDDREKRQANVMDVFIVVGVGLLVQMVCRVAGDLIQAWIGWPTGVVMYILVTIVAMILGMYTNLGRNPFIKPFATAICLVQVSIGTLGVDLSYFKDAGWMIAGANGHGCGHNLLGTAPLAAALAVKEALERGEVQGTIRLYGTPAEELLTGKVYMAKQGVFDDVDAVVAWHPDDWKPGT